VRERGLLLGEGATSVGSDFIAGRARLRGEGVGSALEVDEVD
jgi:hypothetical protein